MEIVAYEDNEIDRTNSLLSLIRINNTFQKQKAKLLFCKPFKVQNKYNFKTTLERNNFQNKKNSRFLHIKNVKKLFSSTSTKCPHKNSCKVV
jgi:hypothetical protein